MYYVGMSWSIKALFHVSVHTPNTVGWGWRVAYTVKKLSDIPVPSRDVTYQTLPRRE
jgi:hypothetical protein